MQCKKVSSLFTISNFSQNANATSVSWILTAKRQHCTNSSRQYYRPTCQTNSRTRNFRIRIIWTLKTVFQRNAELEKLQKAKELEQRTRVECQQALDQYDVLKKIPTLTEQERKENETLTKKKIAKAIIAAQKASQAVMDARVIMGAKGEELTKWK